MLSKLHGLLTLNLSVYRKNKKHECNMNRSTTCQQFPLRSEKQAGSVWAGTCRTQEHLHSVPVLSTSPHCGQSDLCHNRANPLNISAFLISMNQQIKCIKVHKKISFNIRWNYNMSYIYSSVQLYNQRV